MRERSSGTWELTVATGRDPATGKYGRVVRSVQANGKREAKTALARLEVEVRAGHVVAKDPTFNELLDRWMAHVRALGRSDATLYHYERYIVREIKPVFGARRLSKLTAYDIDCFYAGLTARGLAPATVRQIHAIMRASLNQGERWGLVGRNVAKLASPPSQPQREQHPPSVDEVQRLLVASTSIDALFGLYVRVVVATGARRAEACGVRWSDVDFDAGTLSISRSYMVLPNGVRGDRPTKTRSARVITLDPETVVALRAGWAIAVRNAAVGGVSDAARWEGYVFSFDLGGSLGWRPDVVDARWNRTRKLADVPKTIRIHDLRHWQATQLLDAGVPVPTVAARLGHADGTTTMKVYAPRTKRADEQVTGGGRGRRRAAETRMTSERIEQRPLLRVERVPSEAVVVARGGPNSITRLAQHALRTAQVWDLDGEPLYGVSVLCALDDVGPASLSGVLSQLGTYRTVHLTTAGRIAEAGFEPLATAARPHFTVRTTGTVSDEMERLLVVLGEPRDNDHQARPRRGGR